MHSLNNLILNCKHNSLLLFSRKVLIRLFYDAMNYSLWGSSVHGILQARMLEWVAISFSRGSSRPRDRTHVSCDSYIGRWVLNRWATREAQIQQYYMLQHNIHIMYL